MQLIYFPQIPRINAERFQFRKFLQKPANLSAKSEGIFSMNGYNIRCQQAESSLLKEIWDALESI